jgi:hypothetical protein
MKKILRTLLVIISLLIMITMITITIVYSRGIYPDLPSLLSYLTLSIPSPISHFPNGDWTYDQYSWYHDFSSGQTEYYVWRREGSASHYRDSPHPLGYKFSTWDGVFIYFDDWLTENDWEQEKRKVELCDNFLPESKFLPRGEGGYLMYRKAGKEPLIDSPIVCLAIWDVPASCCPPRYEVVIISVTPDSIPIAFEGGR